MEAQRAQAYLDRESGRIEKAVAGFENVLQMAPSNADAWLGLAETELTRFNRSNDEDALDHALVAVDRAIALEPEFWKTFFTHARINYFGSRLGTAIVSANRALQLDANVLTASNLGSFQ